MNRRLRFAIPIVLALLLIGGVALAQPVSYDSGIQVQNLSSTSANIVITFYNQDGTTAAVVNDSVAGDSSNTYFPLEDMGPGMVDVADGFDGSVSISADQPVAAIVNVLGSDGSNPFAFGASYSGFSGGAATSSLPLLMNGNFGFDTWFNVQNIGASATNITVNYSDGTTATANNVAPGAAARFDQATESHAAGWVGSGTVTSSAGDIVATVVEEGPTTLFAYDGFTGGSTNPVMPLVQNNNFGYVSGIQIQNTGGSSTNVTVSYTPGPGQPGTACTEQRSIAAGESTSFALYVFTTFPDPAPGTLISENCSVQQFVGSASVTANSASHDLVVLVNQLNQTDNKGAAYNGFDPAGASDRVVFPLIMDRNFNYFTGWNIFNVGGALNAGDVVCNVVGEDINMNPINMNFNSPALATGAGWNQVNLNTIANGFVGSASCQGPGGSQLVGSVNEVNTSAGGDTFFVYEGFNN